MKEKKNDKKIINNLKEELERIKRQLAEEQSYRRENLKDLEKIRIEYEGYRKAIMDLKPMVNYSNLMPISGAINPQHIKNY